MRTHALRLGAAALAVLTMTAACGGSSKKDTAAQTTPSMSSMSPTTSASAGGPDSAAAGLRGALTGLLDDHVWLAGNALQTAVLKGGNLNDPQVKGAVAALDANSVAISKAVGSVYPAAEKPFLASWRQHIGFFVQYTLGKATKNTAKMAQAEKDLDGYRTSFGQLIHSVVPELPADAVANELKPHVATLIAAINAAVAGSPTFQAKLATAAAHMPMTAAILAGGIAKDKNLAGSTDSPAAGLRGALTGLLDDHVWLAGNALQTAVRKGGNLNDPQVKGAVAALDANSVALSKAVGSVYPAAEKPFLASWRQHIGFFVQYTLGKATNNTAKMTKAEKDLDGYRVAFGQLIHSVVPQLPADAVANELKPHVATLIAAINAAVAGDPSFQTKLAAAAAHMPMTAAVLAGGIAADKGLS